MLMFYSCCVYILQLCNVYPLATGSQVSPGLAAVPRSTAAAGATVAVAVTAQGPRPGAARRTGSVRAPWPPAAVIPPSPSRRHFHPNASSAAFRSVQRAARVLGVPFVLKLDEGETGRVSGDPNVAQGAILAERTFDLVFGRGRAKIADVHLAGQVPLAVACHFFLLLKDIC